MLLTQGFNFPLTTGLLDVPPRKRPPESTQTAPVVSPGPSVHFPAFLHYLESECGMAGNTIAAYRTDLRQFFQWFEASGTGSVFKVDLKLLSRYLDHLNRRGLASSSVARHLVSLKMFFRYLVLDGVLTESAVELLSSPKLWQHLPKVLSPEIGRTPAGRSQRSKIATRSATGPCCAFCTRQVAEPPRRPRLGWVTCTWTRRFAAAWEKGTRNGSSRSTRLPGRPSKPT